MIVEQDIFLCFYTYLASMCCAADESLQKGMLIDPCTPKGYSHAEPLKLSPDSVDDKERLLSTFDSKGNFSECRSAAFKLLQKENGRQFSQTNF